MFYRAGDASDLYEMVVGDGVAVGQGCGLGGGSLVTGGVTLKPGLSEFNSPAWPQEIRNDLDTIISTDFKHVTDMLKPSTLPDFHPFNSLPKMRAMEKTDGILTTDLEDIEDLGKILGKSQS